MIIRVKEKKKFVLKKKREEIEDPAKKALLQSPPSYCACRGRTSYAGSLERDLTIADSAVAVRLVRIVAVRRATSFGGV